MPALEDNKNPNLTNFALNILYIAQTLKNSSLTETRALLVNGSWGSGKTYLVDHLVDYIKEHKNFVVNIGDDGNFSMSNESGSEAQYMPIKLDAFENDGFCDPLDALMYSISNIICDDNQSLKNSFSKLAKTAIGLAGVAIKHRYGDLSEYMAQFEHLNDKNSLDNKYIEKKYIERKEKENEFKNMLSTFGGDNVVKLIFIDELDRCSPKFAINLLERIKYLFNSKNVCFILMADKQALASIVKGYYGGEIDSEKYIEKFFEFTIDYIPEYGFINGVLQANMNISGVRFDFDYKNYIALINPTPRQMARSGRLFTMCSPFVDTVEKAIIGFSRNCDTSFFEYLCETIDKRVYNEVTLIREYAKEFISKSRASSDLYWIDKHTYNHTKSFNDVRTAFFNIFVQISFFCIYEHDKNKLFNQEIKKIKPSCIGDLDFYLSTLENILISGKAPDIIKAIRLFRNMSPLS